MADHGEVKPTSEGGGLRTEMNLNDLFEIFDSKLELDWKDVRGGGAAAGFTVNGVDYVVQLMPGPLLGQGLKVLEASFFVHAAKGDSAFKSTGTSSTPSTVYGVVANALLERLPLEKGDAVFFSAERRHATDDEQHEAKMRLYDFAAKRISRKLGWELYTNKNEFLLTKDFHGPVVSGFKHWQQSIKEELGPEPFPTIQR
jgi:hypothetical protein